MITREVKYAVKQLVTTKLSTMVEESLDDIMRTSLRNAQTSILSVVYNVVEKVILELVRNNVIRETLGTQPVKFIETDAVSEGLLKMLLASSSFMEPIATFLRRQKDTAMEQRKYSTAFASKQLIATVPTFKDDSKSSPSRSDSGNDNCPVKSQ